MKALNRKAIPLLSTMHTPSRRKILWSTAAAGLGLINRGWAQPSETTPLKLVVSFPPGGSTDLAARILQPTLSEMLGRPVVVDNRPGAASQVATQYVARSAPDGNTVLVGFDSHALNPIAKPKLPYDTFKDFAGVCLAMRFGLVIGVNSKLPVTTLPELLDLIRATPTRYNYASTGLGSMNHLVMEDLKRRAQLPLLHVPYAGAGAAIQSVLADPQQVTALSYAAFKGQIAARTIRPLAVTSAQRLPELPHVPTVAETGFKGFDAYSWIGMFASSATPEATLKKLEHSFIQTLSASATRQKLVDAGFEVLAQDGRSAQRYARAEFDRWSRFVQETGLRLED